MPAIGWKRFAIRKMTRNKPVSSQYFWLTANGFNNRIDAYGLVLFIHPVRSD